MARHEKEIKRIDNLATRGWNPKRANEAPSPTTTSEACISWQYFDKRSYISEGTLRLGENAYGYVYVGGIATVTILFEPFVFS